MARLLVWIIGIPIFRHWIPFGCCCINIIINWARVQPFSFTMRIPLLLVHEWIETPANVFGRHSIFFLFSPLREKDWAKADAFSFFFLHSSSFFCAADSPFIFHHFLTCPENICTHRLHTHTTYLYLYIYLVSFFSVYSLCYVICTEFNR